MQDLKNNTHPSDGKDTNRLDQDFRRLLSDAELTPDAELLDQIMDRLASEQPVLKQEVTEIKTQTAPDMFSKASKVRQLRKRFSYAAAIVGILVVLSIGIKELTRPDSVVITASTADSGLASTKPDKAADATAPTAVSVQGGNASKTENGLVAAKAAGLKATENLKNADRTVKAAADLQGNNRNINNNNAVATAVSPLHQASRSKQGGNPAVSAKAADLAKINPSTATSLKAGVENKALAIADANSAKTVTALKEIATSQPAKVAHGDAAATALAANASGTAEPVISDNNRQVTGQSEHTALTDQAAVTRNNEVALTTATETDRAAERSTGKRRNRGILKGFVDKLATTAQAISEEVVSQDEDKTVINVGVFAITTYK